MVTPRVILHSGRDRSVRRRHPWLLSGAVARVEGDPAPGAVVAVVSAEGEVLAHGHFSPNSQIRVRILEQGKESRGDALLAERIHAAVERRRQEPLLGETDAVRLVNSEGDGLPGLVADRYGDLVVLRLSSAGMVARREAVAQALHDASGAAAGIERADAAALRREAVPAREGPLWGTPSREPVLIRERSRRYCVDPWGGQKTGFYLDQRDARDLVERVAAGRRVLDLFTYTGGFAAAAARGGARELTLVDSSREALALAERNLELAGWSGGASLQAGDAFRFLRQGEGGDAQWDLLVIDPPPLARRRADVPRAARAYKDLLLHAFRRAAPGARILAFACSHHVGPDLFQKVAFGASLDAGRPARWLRSLEAPVDHPVSLDHPEGRYLCGLLLEVD